MSSLFPELDAYEQLDPEPNSEDNALSAATRTLLGQLAGAPLPASESGQGPNDEGSERSGHDDEDHDEDHDETKVYHEQGVRLSRPGIAAGGQSLAMFERALGLVGKLRSLKRTEGNSIEFVAEVDEAGTLGCGQIVPLEDAAWKQGKSFGIAYMGELSPPINRALHLFMHRYDGVPLEQLLARVIPDEEDKHMLANDYAESVFYAYAPATSWRRFFEGTELYRGACGGHQGNVAIIDHSDIECFFNQAPYDERVPNFLNIPGIDEPEQRSSQPERDPDQPADIDPSGPRLLFTDIGDIDVIKGADSLVDQALELLADLPGKPTSVVIQTGCLPEVTGDDVDASAARTEHKLRLPVVSTGQYNDMVGSSVDGLLALAEPKLDRPLGAQSIALLGMPAFHGRRSLLAILHDAGIHIDSQVLPELPDDTVESLAKSAVFVGYPWDRYTDISQRLAQRFAPARLITPRAPYGFAGTTRWLREIAAAVDRLPQVEARLEAKLEQLGPRWERLRARARGLRLGFVVDHGNWRSALSSQRSLGVPMVEMLTEMGFGIDILAFAGERSSLPADEHFDAIRIRGYRTIDELDALLASPDVAGWYSEFLFDRRLSRNGKNMFSLREFSMGFDGALDSLESLLRVANMSFFRSYSQYLGPAFIERNARS